MTHRLYVVLCLCALTLCAAPAFAQVSDLARKVNVSFVAERPSIAPGETLSIGLKQVIAEGWHTYWRNPGDSGAPTEIQWMLPEGWSAAPIQWPYPHRMPIGPLMNFGYEGTVMLLSDVTAPADAVPGETVTLEADVLWLVCSDVCIPEDAHLSITLPVVEPGAGQGATDPQTEALFVQTRAELPRPSPWSTRFVLNQNRFVLFLEESALKGSVREALFFPYTDGLIEPAAPQEQRLVEEGLVLQSRPGWKLTSAEAEAPPPEIEGVLVITGTDGKTEALEISAEPGNVPAVMSLAGGIGLPQAVLFALIGGLILNLMPCVLPILSMKALALAGTHGGAASRLHALAYGAGVVVTFAALAGALLLLREAGEAIGWGFQLQQPLFVAALALLIFAVGLNLSGLYSIGGGRLAGTGQDFTAKGGATGSFFTGLLAVVVATPCTAPFMAAALGFALTQSVGLTMAVFLSLAVGFALPFMALGFAPAAMRLFPKPGPWMITFRQALAFPMYGTAAWLLWVLAQQAGPAGLFAVLAAGLALAFGLWAWNASANRAGKGHVVGRAAAMLAFVATVALAAMADSGQPAAPASAPVGGNALGYEPYSETRLESLLAEGRPVFVNATAAWCITCLVNERVGLSSARLKEVFAQNDVIALKADWTNRDPEITTLLARYGRSGVPLYLYFAPGEEAQVLPQLLTEGIVLAALSE